MALVALAQPATMLVGFGTNFSIYSLVSGFALAVLVALAVPRVRRHHRIRALRRFLFPRHIWRHASTALDIRFFFANAALLVLAYSWMVVASDLWRDAAVMVLTPLFGAPTRMEPTWIAFGVTTLLMALALDFGYFITHWAMHDIPALWEFHKVHHSAEVMTPMTEWRQHPVEMVLFPNVYGATMGITYGVLSFIFGVDAPILTLFQMNALLLIHLFTIHHLRHSHIWMPIEGFWGRIIHSPAHHQIHHSNDPRHFGKNLGYCLSIWDWMAGRLCIPRRDERVHLASALKATATRAWSARPWRLSQKAGRRCDRRTFTSPTLKRRGLPPTQLWDQCLTQMQRQNSTLRLACANRQWNRRRHRNQPEPRNRRQSTGSS